ncbi:MAG: preprotein translocase subunit SecG [Bacteroidia bacterium]|jgi:preprotein translocase subunit SecG|tara:strand:+ start:8875 stop:9234 length:360 start_codon:yes stop_codon:yes gene_type:complete
MFTTLIILAIIVSILLILAVLIQNPKGGGIAANFSAANQIAGVKKTNEFVEKATWTLAFALMLLAVGSRFVYSPDVEQTNEFLDRIENSTPVAPTLPTAAPTQEAVPSIEVPGNAVPEN